MGQSERPRIAAAEALDRLREGNRRFVAEARNPGVATGRSAREALTEGQEPFAIILSCSDSRVPSELVFDQGLGDLFVVRVAGNVVAPSLVGSVEFAAAMFHTRLVVVMGHSKCGAITATLDFVQHGAHAPTDNIHDIVERCRSSVETVVKVGGGLSREALLGHSVRANVRNSCDHLRYGSPMLERLSQEEGLMVVGAEYNLKTGEVEFFDGV